MWFLNHGPELLIKTDDDSTGYFGTQLFSCFLRLVTQLHIQVSPALQNPYKVLVQGGTTIGPLWLVGWLKKKGV